MRLKLEKLCSENETIAKQLKVRSVHGRPRLEIDQSELHKVIIDIALFGSSADDRRRTETINSCKTLDDLHDALLKLGFSLSRSATYNRLIPRNLQTLEGKRHIATVPVKLRRAQTDHHKTHPDMHFCTASVRALESLASLLGPKQVFFLSQDDKARVPIGITAVSKQAFFLMHVEYRVKLPDHDWIVAEKHKLIPSVYAGIIIEGDGMGDPHSVLYSGPTFIAIRSGKHSSSTAATHAVDLKRIISLTEFTDLVLTENGNVKPVVIISSDGGPDENPRYPRVISFAVQHFVDFDLDAIFVVTNAPGRSAYNRVERRMAPLSHQLSGLIIPYDSFGTHLDDRNRTIDEDLEKKNFGRAGEILAEVWNSIKIDGYEVHAEYISPETTTDFPNDMSAEWHSKHVRQSQYLLQITKCDDTNCCKPPRSDLRSVLTDGFLPPPFFLRQSSSKLVIPSAVDTEAKFAPLLVRLALKIKPQSDVFEKIPYDYYCPSVQASLKDRVCPECALYSASNKAMRTHCKDTHKKRSNTCL